ncbi:Pectinesterase/pectinesterase inhibitor PPE8B [Apostasia shenzhenica]|uniref:Pectinesterase/pectinesterase inhibitor PPE8B n=1 Tax=Apostasia shenzhenica TaxID=1088818 RepID=A0A2I0B976_9ASPA|nr:Pectinesterase/pectinesterase inhibitor PPE8B [Apostasia shenzhenica]
MCFYLRLTFFLLLCGHVAFSPDLCMATGEDPETSSAASAPRPTTHRAQGSLPTSISSHRLFIEDVTNNLLQTINILPNVTVAKDGSGKYMTVTTAVEAAPLESLNRYIIYIKQGLYAENVDIYANKWNLMLIGDGMDVTVISSNRIVVDDWKIFDPQLWVSCNFNVLLNI